MLNISLYLNTRATHASDNLQLTGGSTSLRAGARTGTADSRARRVCFVCNLLSYSSARVGPRALGSALIHAGQG